jgi:hypothetical protein
MNALLLWGRTTIANLAKILAALFSSIANAVEPDQPCDEPGIKGHRLKRVVIAINDEGLISLRSVNGIVYNKDYGQKPFVREKAQDYSAPDDTDEQQPLTAMNIIQNGSKCYKVESFQGELICKPVACPA